MTIITYIILILNLYPSLSDTPKMPIVAITSAASAREVGYFLDTKDIDWDMHTISVIKVVCSVDTGECVESFVRWRKVSAPQYRFEIFDYPKDILDKRFKSGELLDSVEEGE